MFGKMFKNDSRKRWVVNILLVSGVVAFFGIGSLASVLVTLGIVFTVDILAIKAIDWYFGGIDR